MTNKNPTVAALQEGTSPVRAQGIRGASARRWLGGTARAVLLPGLLLALTAIPTTMAAALY